MRRIVLLLALVLSGCSQETKTVATEPAETYPPIVRRSEPYNAAPGPTGFVIFKNNFDHEVSLATRTQADTARCDGSAGPQVAKLAPNAETRVQVAEGQKLCFSMGRDLAKPLVQGICEARSTDRVALAAYAGCYRS